MHGSTITISKTNLFAISTSVLLAVHVHLQHCHNSSSICRNRKSKMAQGPLKKSKPSTAKRYVIVGHPQPQPHRSLLMICELRPTALAPKRGPRQIAPKKATLIKQQKITKVGCGYHSGQMLEGWCRLTASRSLRLGWRRRRRGLWRRGRDILSCLLEERKIRRRRRRRGRKRVGRRIELWSIQIEIMIRLMKYRYPVYWWWLCG